MFCRLITPRDLFDTVISFSGYIRYLIIYKTLLFLYCTHTRSHAQLLFNKFMIFTGMVAEHQCNQFIYSSEHPKPVLLQTSFNHLHSHSHKHFSSTPESFSLTVTYTLNLGPVFSSMLFQLADGRMKSSSSWANLKYNSKKFACCVKCKIKQNSLFMIERRKHIKCLSGENISF